MKKIIIISKKYKDTDKELLSAQGYNLVLSDTPSIIDLPQQIGEVLMDNDKITFRAISWCMFPIIWAGDILKIKPIKPEDARIGDIVLYKSAGRAYAHRLVKTYIEKDKLYIVTSGESGYRSNKFGNHDGAPADNILGKVIEVKRGKLSFGPDDFKPSLESLIQGRLKLSLWTLGYKAKQYIAKIFIKLQGLKLYRRFFRRLIKNGVSFFIGIPVMKEAREVNSFCFYRRFNDFSEKFEVDKKIYNLNARIYNRPIGNISLLFDIENSSCKTCTLSNFIVRIPYRGGGTGYQLIRKALYLCNKANIDEIRVVLSEEDKIAYRLFKKSGFREWI